MKIKVSLSAIPLALTKPYMKNFNRARYRDLFNRFGEGKGKDKFRIYLPINGAPTVKRMDIPSPISDYVASLGMSIDCYKAGTVLMKDGKRTTRLGAVLGKKPELKKIFDSDPQRQASKKVKQWVVISRHPYDIIGQSFDRGWTSCMHLTKGMNRAYLEDDVKNGTIVAYLVADTDKNINNPTARISIKPHYSKTTGATHVILQAGQVYGMENGDFSHTVRLFLAEVNTNAPTGKYVQDASLYDDGAVTITHFSHTASEEEIAGFISELSISNILNLARNTNNATALKVLSQYDSEKLSLYDGDEYKESVDASLAANPSTGEDILMALVASGGVRVRAALALNISLPDSLARILVRDDAVSVRIKLARNQNLSDQILETLAADSNPDIAEAALSSEIASPELLARCSEGPYAQSCARNSKLPLASMEKISESEDASLRGSLAHNQALPLKLLIKLILDPKRHVAQMAIRHQKFAELKGYFIESSHELSTDFANQAAIIWSFQPGEITKLCTHFQSEARYAFGHEFVRNSENLEGYELEEVEAVCGAELYFMLSRNRKLPIRLVDKIVESRDASAIENLLMQSRREVRLRLLEILPLGRFLDMHVTYLENEGDISEAEVDAYLKRCASGDEELFAPMYHIVSYATPAQLDLMLELGKKFPNAFEDSMDYLSAHSERSDETNAKLIEGVSENLIQHISYVCIIQRSYDGTDHISPLLFTALLKRLKERGESGLKRRVAGILAGALTPDQISELKSVCRSDPSLFDYVEWDLLLSSERREENHIEEFKRIAQP